MGYDYEGWATRSGVLCADGRTILKDAFKDCDGKTVPIMWNHQHNDAKNVLGHALLKNRDEGVRAYLAFNDTPSGKNAKTLVDNGDIVALSIYANQLKESNKCVQHGVIREVSLVLAGANPGAYIDTFIAHSDDTDEDESQAYIYSDEPLELYHSEEKSDKKEEEPVADEKKEPEKKGDEKTVEEVFNTLNEEQKTVVYALIGQALEEGNSEGESDEEGDDKEMKHNVFDDQSAYMGADTSAIISHADEQAIVELAKENGVGSLKAAMSIYARENDNGDEALAHSFDHIEQLFPDFKELRPGAPELITRDLGWIDQVINKANKSPFSRIKTRQMDARNATIRGKGYKKGDEKDRMGNAELIHRSTDPQTIYVKDQLDRDDIIDITDFDVVAYQFGIMKDALKEEIAMATMVSDFRPINDKAKIRAEHVRPIWQDDETYTIHTDVDLAAAKQKLNGTNTSANFGEEYIFAEAIITAALYAREKYKGTGKPDFYCTPHTVNVMLLARDLNGRRIYDSVTDLERALNVNKIFTVEQFEGLTRTDSENHQKKLLGIMVNMADYDYGSTKGGQITQFTDFDIDFNQEKYLIETRLSGALTRIAAAIALEEPVNPQ